MAMQMSRTGRLTNVDQRGCEMTEGCQVKMIGIEHGTATVIRSNATYVVVAVSGVTSNPGSRYSGLKMYAPAETIVFEILEKDYEHGNVRVEECIAFRRRQTTKK